MIDSTQTVTQEDREMAAEFGVPVEQVVRMRQKREALVAAAADESEVTRWTRCTGCGNRASVSVTLADVGSGAWTCNECGAEWVDEFRFTKAEMGRFEAREVAAG